MTIHIPCYEREVNLNGQIVICRMFRVTHFFLRHDKKLHTCEWTSWERVLRFLWSFVCNRSTCSVSPIYSDRSLWISALSVIPFVGFQQLFKSIGRKLLRLWPKRERPQLTGHSLLL